MTAKVIISGEVDTDDEMSNTQTDATNKYTGDWGVGVGPNGSTRILGPVGGTATPLAELYMGFYFAFMEGATAWTTITFSLRNGATDSVAIKFDALGRPYLQVLGSDQPGFGNALSRLTWYYVELWLKVAAGGPGGGAVTLRINGDIIIEVEDIDTRPGGSATVDRIYFNYNSSGYLLVFDDLTVNDTNGGIQDSWPNGIRYLRVNPDGDGNYTDWTPSGAGDHYEQIDEIPPDDADYNSTSSAADRDSYTLESSGSAGIPVSATITTVQQIVYLSEDVVSSDTVDTFLRLSGADDDDGINHSLPLTMARREGLIRHEKPGGGAWGSGDIDALEIGVLS